MFLDKKHQRVSETCWRRKLLSLWWPWAGPWAWPRRIRWKPVQCWRTIYWGCRAVPYLGFKVMDALFHQHLMTVTCDCFDSETRWNWLFLYYNYLFKHVLLNSVHLVVTVRGLYLQLSWLQSLLLEFRYSFYYIFDFFLGSWLELVTVLFSQSGFLFHCI